MFKKLFRYLANAGKGTVWLCVFLKILSGCLPFVYIVLYAKFIDSVVNLYSGTGVIATWVFSAFVVFGILNYMHGMLFSFLFSKLGLKLQTGLRVANIQKISKLEYSHIENAESYDLIKRVRAGTPTTYIQGFFGQLGLIEIFLNIIAVVASVVLFSPWVVLIVLIALIIVFVSSAISGRQNYDAVQKYLYAERRFSNYEDILVAKNYSDERAIFNYNSWFEDKWKSSYDQAGAILLKAKRFMYFNVKLASTLVTVSFLGIIFFLLNGVLKGNISLGYFSSVSAQLIGMMMTISWSLMSNLQQIVNCKVFLKDVAAFENLSEKTLATTKNTDDLEDKRVNFKTVDKIESIEFKDVTFKYPGNENYTLKNLSFKLNSSESYALVGKNGAGKTTITKLLLGLYPEYEGEIFINDIKLEEIKNSKELFSIAFQDFAKYEISLKENIVFGDDNKLSEAEMNKLLKTLNLFTEDDARLKEGLNLQLGYLSSKNTNLSIGQWQKLILIRALATNGLYYILDEPTASLDPVAEAGVYNDFMKILNDFKKPSFIITHRLGAARLANKILVLDDGELKEFGGHDELIAKDGLYKKMYETQKGWYV